MGTWDELCILCGVAASGGCSVLGSKYGFDEDVKRIANDIAPGDEETRQIIRDMLRATFSDDNPDVGHPYPWRPEGMGFQRYNEMLSVAIGHFDEKGECEKRGKLVRNGRGAEVRRVDGLNGGDFTEVVRVISRREKLVPALSICSVFGDTPNVALCEPCYHYLDAWLARQDLPSRSCAFPSDPEPMSFGEELYEIVNSQQELRGVSCVGSYRCIWSEKVIISSRFRYSAGRELRRHRGYCESMAGRFPSRPSRRQAPPRGYRSWLARRRPHTCPVARLPSVYVHASQHVRRFSYSCTHCIDEGCS